MGATTEAIQRLCAKLRLSIPLLAVYDCAPTSDFAPLVEAQGAACCFAFYPLWQAGRTVVIRKGSSDFLRPDCGCPGAQRAFGLATEYPPFMAHFLTDGVGAPLGEGLKASAELMQEFLDNARPVRPSGDTVLLGPLRAERWEFVRSVTFFVDPDRLAALLTLAGYWSAEEDLAAAPFSSGCGLLWRALGGREIDRPIIGSTDLAMRKYLPPEILSLTVSPRRFEQMTRLPEGSFLDQSWWNQLMERRGLDKTIKNI